MRAAWLVTALVLAGCIHDPSAGIFRSKEEMRNLECKRMSHAQGHQLYPGVVPDLPPRGAYWTTDAIVCGARIVKLNERPAQDEAVLTTLSQSVGELTRLATGAAPPDTLWHVEAFYPQMSVAQKIAIAARVDLAEHGFRVSDRVPVVAAGDVAVLKRVTGDKFFHVLCRRYFAENGLHEGDGFLGITPLFAIETQLHAGVCLSGKWRWLE
jgi:hypothetical protein